ncbi:IS110 family transposase, partial [Flavobacterium sp. HXWNR70]
MKKSNNYVGIDISKLTFDVAISSPEDKYKHLKFANNHEGFMMFLEHLNASESICIMEASGPYY